MDEDKNTQKTPDIANRDLFLPYLAPYFAYVAIASFFSDRIPVEWSYALRIIIVTPLIVWAWRWYVPLRGPRRPAVSVAVGIGAGLLGCVVWIALLAPFVEVYAGEPWSRSGFALRLIAASTLVPVFEELFIRGYVFRVALQWDRLRSQNIPDPFYTALDRRCIDDVTAGDWSRWAVVVSTLAFAMGHAVPEWPASVAYGLLMIGVWIWRKDLISCVVAHATTNFVLAVIVGATGAWGLW